ncbi:MAG: hypothetical protein OSJ60_15360 [Lachnospiraceae bacterium]|nr:hypothetical protein [Lachnospiraceae bacterium]
MGKEVLRGVRDIVVNKDSMWIIVDTLPCLFRYYLLSRELELTAIFPEAMRSGNFAFSKIVKLEDEIYFIPRLAKDIFYYDISNKEFHKLNVSFEDFCDDKGLEVVVKERFLYCIHRYPNRVIKINSVTKEVNIFEIDMNPYIEAGIEKLIYKAFQGPCIYQEKIIWSHYKNILIIFDTEKESFSIKKLEGLSHEKIKLIPGVLEVEDYITGVRLFEDILWLFSFNGKIYQYDEGIHQLEDTLFDNYMHYDDAGGKKYFFLHDIVPLKKELIIIPSYKNKCVKYNIDTKRYEEVLNDYAQNWDGNKRDYSLCKKMSDKKMVLYSYYESSFYILDVENNSVCKREIEISYRKLIKENPDFKWMVIKDGVYSFDDLMYLFEGFTSHRCMKEKKLQDTSIGKQIYEIIEKQLKSEVKWR